ncbi:MAG: efflux RND transporter permease subunit, partial [Limisphaerales bacterium]
MKGEPHFWRLPLRPLLWVLILIALIVLGLSALIRIPVEVLPRFNFPEISVTAHEPGATAAELESQIVRPLEGEILSLPGLSEVRSVMGDGTVETDVRFRDGTDARGDLLMVNGALDRARADLPADVQPRAEIMGNSINEIADYAAEIPSGVTPAEARHDIEANVVPVLRAVPGVQTVELSGAGEEALWIQPDLVALRRYGVGVTALTQAVKDQILLQPSGFITAGHQDVLIEARNLPTQTKDWEQVPVPGPDGPIPLGALARIVRSAIPSHDAILLDGRPSVSLVVFKQPTASTVPVATAIESTLKETLGQVPAGVHWIQIYDQGHLVHIVGSDLSRNLIIGGVLAVGVLFWALGTGRGIWILGLGIPLSLLLGIAGLYLTGQSLNLVTLGALTVAVGLLADDAIIVLESIYQRWEQGDAHWPGIWHGLRDITMPALTGTLTTVAVFVPLLFIGGLARLFFVPFALAMTLSLLASLLVSLSFIPLALGFIHARPRKEPTAGGKLLKRIRKLNERLFSLVARRPGMSLAITFGALVLSLAGLALVSVNFLPLPNEGVLLESFTLPPGSSLIDTEAAAQKMARRLLADPDVAHVYARIGSSGSTAYTEPAYSGEIQIVLKPGVKVKSLDAIGQRVLATTQLTGVQESLDTPTIERVGESLSGLPQPFVLHIFGGDVHQLRDLADRVGARLKSVSALSDIFNNDAYPMTQLQLQPRPGALAAYGLTPVGLYSQIRPLLNGEVIAQEPDGNVPLDIYVRLRGAPEKSLNGLSQLPIKTVGWTPLGQLANLKLISTPNQLEHIDGALALDILATPRGPIGNAIAAAKRSLKGVDLPPGYRLVFGGLYRDMEKTILDLAIAALAALGLMTGILALKFDGFLAPGLLLLEIPLALIGGAIALIISGVGLNVTGLVGFLTLIGIGLRNGIVLL